MSVNILHIISLNPFHFIAKSNRIRLRLKHMILRRLKRTDDSCMKNKTGQVNLTKGSE